jgi:hypothetical protein
MAITEPEPSSPSGDLDFIQKLLPGIIDKLKLGTANEETLYREQSSKLDNINLMRSRIERRTREDNDMVDAMIKNQSYELLFNQKYIYDFEDVAAQVHDNLLLVDVVLNCFIFTSLNISSSYFYFYVT